MIPKTMRDLFPKKSHAVIGMLHMPALPGSPLAAKELSEIREFVLADAKTLTDGGVDGLLMENFGDVPFHPGRVPAHVVALMTAIAVDVKRATGLPLGINVLRNDGLSALAIAHAASADFIRVNVLSGARVTDQGVIQGIAHELLRYRKELNSTHIKIIADVDVKHSAPLAPRPVGDEVEDVLKRALADAVIVSGAGTGKPISKEHLESVAKAAGNAPVVLGSGVTAKNIKSFQDLAWGFIVGTAFKRDGLVQNPVDLKRVEELVARIY